MLSSASFRLITAACLLALPLAACSSDDDDSKDDAAKKEEKVDHKYIKKQVDVLPICPQVAAVHGLDVMRNAADGGQWIDEAKMTGVQGDCDYPDEGGIDITFNLNFIAKRGAQSGVLHTQFPYFVAIVDPSDNVLTKTQYMMKIDFSSSENYTEHQEAMHVVIPLPHANRALGPDYKVLAGFQLPDDQAHKAVSDH